MSTTTQHLGLIQPALSEKHGATTYKANNTIIDNAYGEYLNNYEQSLENVAPIEGDTASTNYSVGQYIIKDGGLYRVTSSIASGESIVVGTNVIATSLNEAVASLNNTVASINNAIGTVNVATNGNLQSQVSALQDSVDIRAAVYYVASDTVSVAAGARSSVSIPLNLPSGSTFSGAAVFTTPNPNWVFACVSHWTSTDIVVAYHNESSTALSGQFRVLIFVRRPGY